MRLLIVNIHICRPAQHRKQAGVGDGEIVAGYVLLAGKLSVEPVEPLADMLFGDDLKVGRP